MQKESKQTLRAFLTAPLAGPLGLFSGFVFQIPLRGIGDLFELLLLLYLFTTPVIYFFSILLGIPLYLLLRSLGGLNRGLLMAGWALIGDLSILIVSGGKIPESADQYLILIPFALGGCAVGYLFWRVINPGREDSRELHS